MKTLKICFLIFYLVAFPAILSAEKVSLSTYYPAPFGAYDRIKLVPRDSLALDPHCDDPKDIGTMYYDNGSGILKAGIYVCRMKSEDEFVWTSMSVSVNEEKGKISSGKIICIKEDGSTGVCMSNPSFDGTCACQ